MKDLISNQFQNQHVLVIGDAMIDRYFNGAIERKSPEADVPIVRILETDDRLGGAANVALNVVRLGAKASLLTIAGADSECSVLQHLLDKEAVESKVVVDGSRTTTVKARVYDNTNYVLRFDREDDKDISEEIESRLLEKLQELIKLDKPDVVVLQDYNKGLFTSSSIQAILKTVKSEDIPIAVDPKVNHFFEFTGIDLLKPNLKEVATALGISLNGKDKNALKEPCISLLEKMHCERVLLTLSENGVLAVEDNNVVDFPAEQRNVLDVSGAGDTVIAMASLLLSQGATTKEIAYWSNYAGGMVIESKGVSCLSLEDILNDLKR